MDFFDRQTHARRQTRRLAWLFCLTLAAVLVVNNLLLCTLVACFTHPVFPNSMSWHPVSIISSFFYLLGEALVHPGNFCQIVFHWQPILWVSLGTLISIAGGCIYKIRELSDGGPVVAEFLGGRRVPAKTDDPDEQRLRNVVEEMAIASGTPVPEIYVLDCERGINTFAAGHTHDDIAIGVTRGCLKLLTRDELQGVIAHEFSHILNGDTRFNMRLIGLAHGFFWPTLLGRMLIYPDLDEMSSDASIFVEKDKVKVLPTAPLGCLLVFLGSFSLPFVRLIKSAICRQREWLADAAAVQFTRNPEGITGALKKIGGLFKQGRLDTPHAEVASHLYFANCDYDPWFSIFATHPPLTKRILAIDPQFDGTFPEVKMLEPNQAERELQYAELVYKTVAGASWRVAPTQPAADTITGDHLRQASLIRLALPGDIKAAVRTAEGAANVICALLLSDDEAVRDRQIKILQASLEPSTFAQFQSLQPQIESLDDKYKLPLAEFAVPALRENDLDAHQMFSQVLNEIIECNQSLDLFEYALTKMVTRQLRAYFEGPDTSKPKYGRVRDMLPQCVLLLSALAHVGNDNEADARAAFAQGASFLDAQGVKMEFIPRSDWDLAGVDAALNQLAAYHEPLRRNVLLACGKTVTADGQVTIREAELLRAIADSLRCPMPPFVDAIRDTELAQSES